MNKITSFLFFLILITGCVPNTKKVYVDIANAKTDAGYINSKLESIGTLYLYDMNNSTLNEIAHIKLSNWNSTPMGTYKARGINNIAVRSSVVLNDTEIASIKSLIQNSIYIYLNNTKRIRYTNTITDLSKHMRNEISNGKNLVQAWSLDKAIDTNSHLRYVMIFSMITSDSAKFNVNKGADLNMTVGKGKNKTMLNVYVEDSILQEFCGSNIPVLISYNIYKASIQDNRDNVPTYHFALDTQNRTKFNQALRK